MNEQQILKSVDRPGWIVTGRRPETKTVSGVDANGNTTRQDQPTGNQIWTIADPNNPSAPPDEITVQMPTPVGGTTAWPTDSQGNPVVPAGASGGYTVVKGPTKAIPANAASSKTPLSGYQIVTDPNTGVAIAMVDPADPSRKIDLPAVKPGQAAQVVNGGNGVIYSWDGQKLTQQTDATPDKQQIINGANGAIYSWDGQKLTPQVAPQAAARHVAVVGNNLVDTDTGKVVYQGADGIKFQTAQDGTILAIDPNNPSNVQPIWSPQKNPSLVPGQSSTQPRFLQQNPDGSLSAVANPIAGDQPPTEVSGQAGPNILQRMPDGSYRSVPNPAYVSKQQQALQDYDAGLSQIQQDLAKGTITVDQANQYKGLLQKNYQAALLGTTPYQQYQDQQAIQQARTNLGASLLNNRVNATTGLANNLVSSALGIAGNKAFRDPNAVAGFMPFQGAQDYVTNLMGGPDVYTAAKSALMSGLGPDPASALLSAALTPPAAPAPTVNAPAAPMPSPLPATVPGVLSAPLGRPPETAAESMARNLSGRAVNLLLQGAGITA